MNELMNEPEHMADEAIPKPTALSVSPGNISQELKAPCHWVVWRYVFKDRKWTKPPFRADGKGNASSTDPATWSDYETAVATYRNGGFDGIGIVLKAGLGIVGVDLDHCYDPAKKTIEPWATGIINHFNSYSELSPSGTGVRIFLKGKLPGGGHKKGNIEVYASGRYLTTTGRVLKSDPMRAIEPRQAEIDAFLVEHFPEPKIKTKPGNPSHGNGHVSDSEILEIGLHAKNGDKLRALLNGDIAEYGYPSPSEADLALCSMLAFYSKDETQIDRIYRGSGLFREKWDAKHGAQTYGEQTIAKAIDGTTEHYSGKGNPAQRASQRAEDEWLEPQPLVTKIKPKPYPLDALPKKIQAAVVEVQQFIKAPIALVASSALGALSLACQAYADVTRAEKLSGPVSLFLMIIAESGERKSTCDEFFSAGIREYQSQRADALKPTLVAYRSEVAAWEAKYAGTKDKIRQLAKSNKASTDIEAQLRELEKKKPQAPRITQLLRGDDTPENLAWALMHEWPAAGVASSEAGLILGAHGMNKENIMRNLGLLNILWDGGSLPIGRRHSESFTLKGARLTVALQVQEATLRNFIDKSDGLARGTGFMARFLIAWPESTQGFRPFTEAPSDWPALGAFNRRITDILKQPVLIADDGSISPRVMCLTTEAKSAWVTFHDAIERQLASGGELYDVRDVASKSADNAARLAALFQIFEHGLGGAVSGESFEGASRIATWHLNESRRFFGELALPAKLANAARLDRWLIEYCRRNRKHTISTKIVQQCGPSGLREKSEIESTMCELDDLNRARLTEDGRRRIIKVNPALLIDGGES